MQAYRLIHAVTFETQLTGKDPDTGAVVSLGWVPAVVQGKAMADYPAEVLTGKGRELQAAATTHAEITARINVPWFQITEAELATLRIVWDGRIYNIEDISTDKSARREWRLLCTGGVNNG